MHQIIIWIFFWFVKYYQSDTNTHCLVKLREGWQLVRLRLILHCCRGVAWLLSQPADSHAQGHRVILSTHPAPNNCGSHFLWVIGTIFFQIFLGSSYVPNWVFFKQCGNGLCLKKMVCQLEEQIQFAIRKNKAWYLETFKSREKTKKLKFTN